MLAIVLVATLGWALSAPLEEIQNGIEHPEENFGLFEGDIELVPGQDPRDRLAQRNRNYRWPNGDIPYVIDSNHFTSSGVRAINLAMQTLHDKTMVNGKECLKFVPRTNETAFIRYRGGTGCHTPVGYHRRESGVTLGKGCGSIGTIMHETMHALGFWHEQSRPDRDNYITIKWDNIDPDHVRNFDKYSTTMTDTLGLKYDYESVMHYNAYSFAVDRSKPTIVVKQAGHTIGQRTHLSPSDIKEIQLYYGCATGSWKMVTFTTTPSPPVTQRWTEPTVKGGDMCTFQTETCSWSNTIMDTTDWVRRQGGTPSTGTGPSVDNSGSSTGYYLYLEASGHTHQKAYLISDSYPHGYHCLSLFYHMHGSDEGSLKIEVVTGYHRKIIHTITGNQGNVWHHYQLTLHVGSGTFEFEIEGNIGQSDQSGIAIDDLSVYDGKCTSTGKRDVAIDYYEI